MLSQEDKKNFEGGKASRLSPRTEGGNSACARAILPRHRRGWQRLVAACAAVWKRLGLGSSLPFLRQLSGEISDLLLSSFSARCCQVQALLDAFSVFFGRELARFFGFPVYLALPFVQLQRTGPRHEA